MKYVTILLVVLGGVYFIFKQSQSVNANAREGFEDSADLSKCPNVLMQKGAKYYLYNSNLVEVPGVNPVVFQNLEDYVEFIAWQRSRGVRCPVMFLQHGYDAQGNVNYKVRPSPLEPQGGLPPGLPNYTSALQSSVQRDSAATSAKTSQVIPAEDIVTFDANAVPESIAATNTEASDNLLYSPNAMDDNWGGKLYTQKLVDSGAYAGSEVSIAIE